MLLRNKAIPFEDLFNDSLFDEIIPRTSNVPYDVIEDDDSFEINLVVAGLNKEDINLEVEEGELIVTGERFEKEDVKYNHKNSYYGKFKKKFTLPKDVLVDKIDAEYVNGVLNVKVPKDKELISSKTIVVR